MNINGLGALAAQRQTQGKYAKEMGHFKNMYLSKEK